MGLQTGNDGVVHINGTAIAQLRGWTLNRTANRVDATVFGQTSRSSLAGFSDGQGTITVGYDETDTNGQQALLAAFQNKTIVSLVLFPKGNVSGHPRITVANAVILGPDDSGGIDELLERTFAFGKSTGDFVEDLVP